MKISTFLILADPQIYDDGSNLPNLSKLNVALNNLATDQVRYPQNNTNITCGGLLVGKPEAVFFAGDLTDFGGQVNWIEYFLSPWEHNLATVTGGTQSLNRFRGLYDPVPRTSWTDPPVTRLDGCGPLYFGLGNHDVALWDDTIVEWRGYNGDGIRVPTDYYTYQMWNFVNQMHTGYDRPLINPDGEIKPVKVPARFPIPSSDIDTDPGGTYEFDKYSTNYMTPLGPIDIYQLHFFSGDSLHGRKSGLDWVKRKLASRGYHRPVFVIQHLPPSLSHQGGEHFWNETARDQLLEVFRLYDLRGVRVGHLHTPEWIGPVVSDGRNLGVEGEMKEVQEFMIGWAMGRKFGAVRVEEDDEGLVEVNVVDGLVNDQGRVTWSLGWSDGRLGQLRKPKREVYVSGIEVVHRQEPVNDWSHELPWYVTDEGGGSGDLNDGFAGESPVYIKPLLTTIRSNATTGFELVVQDQPLQFDDPEMQHLDLAPDGAKTHRYLIPQRICGQPPVTQLFLWREDGKQAPRIGWALSGDLNKGRSGDCAGRLPLRLECEIEPCPLRSYGPSNGTGGCVMAWEIFQGRTVSEWGIASALRGNMKQGGTAYFSGVRR